MIDIVYRFRFIYLFIPPPISKLIQTVLRIFDEISIETREYLY